MSKPLATKVSTPLSENVQIGPKVSIFFCGNTHAASDHDIPTTMIDCRQDKLVFVLLTWSHTLDTDYRTWFQSSISLVCLSSANCLLSFLCIIFKRGFLLGGQPCRPIWCSVQRMVWTLTGWPLWTIFERNRPFVYIEKFLDLCVQPMKNGAKTSVAFIILFSVCIYVFLFILFYPH